MGVALDSVRTRLIGAALLAALASVGCSNDEITPRDHANALLLVASGVRLAEAGDLDSAAAKFIRAGELDSTNADAHYRLAMVREYEADYASAVTGYERALRQDSTHAAAHLNVGQLYGRQGSYDDAFGHFKAALRHAQEQEVRAVSHYCMGMTWGIRGDAAQAAEAYDRAIQLDSAFARAHVAKAQELLRLERPDEALPALLRAIEIDHGLSVAHSNLASCYRALERFDEASAAEDTAAALRERREQRLLDLGL